MFRFMELSAIKTYLLSLLVEERLSFLSDIEESSEEDKIFCKGSRRELLNNKQSSCPHCGDLKYVKFGLKSGFSAINIKVVTRVLQSIQALGCQEYIRKIRLMLIWY